VPIGIVLRREKWENFPRLKRGRGNLISESGVKTGRPGGDVNLDYFVSIEMNKNSKPKGHTQICVLIACSLNPYRFKHLHRACKLQEWSPVKC
jgi:hypothetical protein